jgi:uncharacterized membrane protein
MEVENTIQEGRTIAIISYITLIGTVIAFVMNQNKNNSFAAFHIRQALGLVLLAFALNLVSTFVDISLFYKIVAPVIFVLWLLGLVYAIQGKEKTIPLIGDQFQIWFKNLG